MSAVKHLCSCKIFQYEVTSSRPMFDRLSTGTEKKLHDMSKIITLNNKINPEVQVLQRGILFL